MKRSAIWTMIFAAVLAATGCQTVQRFAWFKRDKAPEDSSAVARSAKPELPSAQSSPQAVAIAGLTPAASPSSTNLAAAGTPATTATAATAAAAGPPTPPPVSVPLTPATSPALAASTAPASPFPTDGGLADKLVTTPSTKGATSGLGTTTSLPAATASGSLATPKAAAVAAAGPYDPNAYKPSTATSADDAAGPGANDVDRYAIGSTVTETTAAPAAPVSIASTPSTTSTAPSNALQSDPADRYGSQRYTTPTTQPGATPLPDPVSVAADRYANPTLPSLPSKTPGATTPAAPSTDAATSIAAAPSTPTPPASSAASQSPIRLASAPGQYRPGGTSSYKSTVQQIPIEVATRPAPPAATGAATPAATGAATPAASTGSTQPWTPSATLSPAGSRY